MEAQPAGARDAAHAEDVASERSLGAGRFDVAAALAVALVYLLIAAWADRALAAPPTADLVAVGAIADPHHVHIDAIYGSFAREVSEGGGLLVHNHQTSEPHPPTLARPWDYLVGRLAGLLGRADPAGLLWLDRLFAILLFPLGCALFFAEVLRRRASRIGALVAVAFGGGLYWIDALREHAGGWLEEVGGLSGLGFAYPALLVGVPHLALEVAALTIALGAALRGRRTGDRRWAIVAGVAILALASVRPYTAPAALVGVGLAYVWGRPRTGLVDAAIACVPTLPLLLHDALVLKGDSVFAALDVTHPSPPLLEQAIFFGAPLLLIPLLFVPRIRRALRATAPLPAATVAGVAGALFVVLALVEGPFVAWQVEAMLPLPMFAVLLAARAFEGLLEEAPRPALGLGGLILLLHVGASAAYAREVSARLDDPRSPLWMLADERAALDHVSSLAAGRGLTADDPPIVLLCEPTFGRVVPWLAGVRVYAGHGDHTVDFAAKAARARAFFRFGSGAGALRDAGVTHVLFAPRAQAPGVDPDAIEELVPEFRSGAVGLYRVR